MDKHDKYDHQWIYDELAIDIDQPLPAEDEVDLTEGIDILVEVEEEN